MSRESQLWNWLSAARRQLNPTVDLNRVENLIEAGTPDVEGAYYWKDSPIPLNPQFFLELKSHERPARLATPIAFPLRKRFAQTAWLRRRWLLGCNAWFFLQVGSGHERILYLAPGDLGEELKKGLTESQLAVECAARGAVFAQGSKQSDVIKAAISCRHLPFPKSPS